MNRDIIGEVIDKVKAQHRFGCRALPDRKTIIGFRICRCLCFPV